MLQIYQLISCLQSSVNQQGLLADKKREGRCSDDYFFFTVCGKHFSGFIEALDSEGILCTLALKKVLRQPITTRGIRSRSPSQVLPAANRA